MKKWAILIVVIGAVCATWYWVRTNVRYTPDWDKAKFGEVTKGEIRVPITAAGLIEPNERIQIKPEASGEVKEVLVKPGDYVHAGDTLVVLDKEDEERRLVQVEAAHERARALAAQADVAVLRAEQNILSAQSRVEEIRGNADIIQIDLDRQRELSAKPYSDVTEDEIKTTEARKRISDAQLKSAQAAVEISKYNLSDAKETVKIQQAALTEAEKTVEDARERLSETTILAPQNGIVTLVPIAVGNLVQSTTQGFTGGTLMMELADVSSLKVITRVDEADIGRVLNISPLDALPDMPGLREAEAKNQALLEQRSGEVRITVDAFPEDEFEGRIMRAEPQGKLNAGSSIIQFDVHVGVTDEERYRLPLGTQAQVEFTVESVSDAILVPAEAVMSFQDERGVWVPADPPAGSVGELGKRFVRCRFGITDGANTQIVEVTGGEMLKPGQKVYTKLPPERDDR